MISNPNRFNGMRSDRRKELELLDAEMLRDAADFQASLDAQWEAMVMRIGFMPTPRAFCDTQPLD